LALLAAVGSFSLAAAQAPKAGGDAGTITNSIGMKLRLIPAGEFQMGSRRTAGETAAFFNKTYGVDILKPEIFEDEQPRHKVRITTPFYLGTCHVTVGQFRRFVEDTLYKTDAQKSGEPGAVGWDPEQKEFRFNSEYSWQNAGFPQTDEHPAVNLSWNDAVAFCRWLSRKEAETYRLPTEAEWEYACRAGTDTRFSSGDDPETLVKVGNVADATFAERFPERKMGLRASDGYLFTSPVGSFRPNAFGLYDMHGNAWQWCADWYAADYYATSKAEDPAGPASGKGHVMRGGSWCNWAVDARSAARHWSTPEGRGNFTGFRVARDR
jgi:formylglycine-generating enzyme required for sulfatase activity